MDEETYQERQQNELLSLEAIYMDDFVNLTKDFSRGIEVKLHLMPQQGMSGSGNIHVTVDMLVSCPPTYPDQPPEISFHNPHGLSTEKIRSLKKSADVMVKRLRGQEMILQLAQSVQQFLHAHNVPGMLSFFDEMKKNKEKEEEKLAQEKLKKLDLIKRREEKERREVEEEIQRRQDAVKEEARKRREQKSTSSPIPIENNRKDKTVMFDVGSNSPVHGSKQSHQPDPVDSNSEGSKSRNLSTPRFVRNLSDSFMVAHPHPLRQSSIADVTTPAEVVTVKFSTKVERTIHRGCILDDHEGGKAFIGMDVSSGQLMLMREWNMKWKHGKGRKPLPDEQQAAEDCMKQLNSIEHELFSLLKHSHPNIVSYLALNKSQGKDSTIVQLLMEFVSSGTLEHQIVRGAVFSFETIRHYSIDLLEALSFLHNKAVVHKKLTPGCVYIDVGGGVKLANYSLVKRLNDLQESVIESKQGVRFSEEKSFVSRGGKKGDIFQFGVLLLSLLIGEIDVLVPLDVPSDLPPELYDFLTRCLDQDERSRPSVQILKEHPFIKTSLLYSPEAPLNTSDKAPQDESLSVEFVDEQPPTFISTNSRLHAEFEILDFLGKGGFGNVIQVKNRLDGNLYAIKRILLNPRSKELNKKITREVKLLSRLNHENVVRYFNSWIETAVEPVISDTEDSKSTNTSESARKDQNVQTKKNSFGLSDSIEENAPRLSAYGSVEWSTSGGTGIEDESNETSSDDEDVFGMSFLPRSDSSDGISFEHSKNEDDTESASEIHEKKSRTGGDAAGTSSSETEAEQLPVNYLYIQMEFCEKSTLRTSIDDNLYQDNKKIWRYFREILEGLVHIHSQGMIHRDLKPVNIFISSNDLVKIGDFGLATSEQRVGEVFNEIPSDIMSPESLRSQEGSREALTGKVGTALYVSPELCQTKTISYNQKVDLYSLGIIFFEMCTPPLATGMERVKTLGQLRQKEILFPDYFDEVKDSDKAHIIQWLLNHDPNQRPTAQELLQSKHLPPLQMEDARLQDMISQTISNDQSKGYRFLVNELFTQPHKTVKDFTYDIDMHKGFSVPASLAQQHVYLSLCQLFEKHGAVKISAPTLLPKNDIYVHTDQLSCFMDNGGGLVSLPYDLRVPFARYVARNNLTSVKRYSIEKVFRERKILGSHPRELTECAFDIVTNITNNLLPEAEVLYVVSEVIKEFPVLEDAKSYFIRINHISLLKAILAHCSIPDEKHDDVIRILGDARETKLQNQTRLISLSLTEQQVNNIYNFIELECSFKELSSHLKPLTSRHSPNASLAKNALHELEAIINQAQVFGVRQEILVVPSLVHFQYFSGYVFQYVAKVTRKHKKPSYDVLAAGGRYDKLIPQFQRLSSTIQGSSECSAVGVSIHFEKIVTSLLQHHETEQITGVCDVLVCSMGSSYSLKERIKVVRDLWEAGIKADILYDTSKSLEDIQVYCRSFGITHMAILKDHQDSGMIWLRSFDKEKTVVDTKLSGASLVECLQPRKGNNRIDIPETKEPITAHRSMSAEYSGFTSSLPVHSVTFLTAEREKLEYNTKKRHDRQIQARIQQVLECLSPKVFVEVIAVDLPLDVLKSIATTLELDGDEPSFQRSVTQLCNLHAKHRKYLTKIADTILSHKESDSVPVIILYSYRDEGFKVML